MAFVTKDENIGAILNQYPEVAPVLMEMGMHCIGCFASQMESLEEACDVHGLDADQVAGEVNEFISLSAK